MDFLGKGYAYPLQTAGNGKFRLLKGVNKVRAGIYCILDTPVGTRIALREFGCRIHEITFENDNEVAAELARLYVQEALEKWEPRIEPVGDEDIQIHFEGSKMMIHITYRIKGTNTVDNVVYPYYMEGVA